MQSDETSTAPSAVAPQPFRFHGSGGEYFRIWIVNLLLTIVTLGIYSAWAKVRRLRYFYGQMELAGSRFEYHAEPLKILLGRIVGVVMLLTYNFSFNLFGPWGLVLVLSVLAVFPLLIRSSFRFRAAYSSYRGIRFGFDGRILPIYAIIYGFALTAVVLVGGSALLALFGARELAAISPLAVLLVGGVAYPIAHRHLKAYQHGNSRWGNLRATFEAGNGPFIRLYVLTALLGIGVAIPLGIAAALAIALLPGGAADTVDPTQADVTRMVLFGVPLYLGYMIAVVPFFLARLHNLVWNSTRIGEHRFESRLQVVPYMWVWGSNLVLIVLTLGFFTPWAAVRLARYRAQCMTLIPAESLDAVLARVEAQPSAVGSETLDVFDFDISL